MKATRKTKAVAALLAAALAIQPIAAANAETVNLNKPNAGTTMFFADRYATAYYTVNKDDYRTVVTIGPGPQGQGNPMELVNVLGDGETAEYTVGGYGDNAIEVKLQLTREGGDVKANVITVDKRPNT